VAEPKTRVERFQCLVQDPRPDDPLVEVFFQRSFQGEALGDLQKHNIRMSELLTPFELFDVDFILSREIKPGSVPAADRIVPLNHNQPEYVEAIAALDQMQEALRGENAFSEDGEKQVAEVEVSLIHRLLEGTHLRIKSLWALAAASLSAIKKKMWDQALGQAAALLLATLWLLVKALILVLTGSA
jgi:hypothetical protein